MSKGLYHCSKCKKHFYDAEATQMHIKDSHAGDAQVLRHPTKRELLIQNEILRARIEKLEAALARIECPLGLSITDICSAGTCYDCLLDRRAALSKEGE